MEYVKVAKTDELASGNKKKVSWQKKEILLVNIEGAYYAVSNKCSHMGGSLYDGKLEGSHVICPRHGSIFDVRTGNLVQKGKNLTKANVGDIHSYPVRIENDDILIGVE